MINITIIEEFVKPSSIHEQLLVGYLWSSPNKYQKMRSHKLKNSTFTNERWSYFYFLGKEMFDNGIRDFDDKTVYSYLNSKKSHFVDFFQEYEEKGGYDVVHLLMEECNSDSHNEEFHLEQVQKYEVLRNFEKEGFIDKNDQKLIDKLTHSDMSLKSLRSFFQHKVSTIFSNVNHGEVVEHDFLDEELIDEAIEEMHEGDVMGLPLHDSPRLNRKIKGWRTGTLTYLVLATGVGKTSFGFEKFILSLIENKKKGLIFANEESVKKFIRLMLATVAARILKTPVNRERMTVGNFDKETREKLDNAKKWIVQNNPNMIKFFHLKKYRVDDIINRLEMYRPLGYEYCFIDTFKPDRSGGEQARWERFSNNAQEIYDAIQEDSNNMGALATVQLKIGKEYKFLDNSVIGKSGEITEVADTILAGRKMYDDEYDKIYAYNYQKNPLTDKSERVPYDIKEDKTYVILFITKDREGGTEEQILYEVAYGINSWNEVAYCTVPRTSNNY